MRQSHYSARIYSTVVHELIPPAKWQFGNIPAILKQMVYVASLKGGYFGLMLFLLEHFRVGWNRRGIHGRVKL